MVDVIGRAKVIITGDVDAGSIDKAGSTIGSKLKVGAAVGAAALGTLTVAGVKAFKAFEDAEAVSQKLANVLGNMGQSGAVEEVEKLATSLQRQTGISDETIKSGQTLLATFSSVAESAGQVGGTFDRATRIAVDMSSVFGSVESASRTLGKALEDPTKAAALLRRSNVVLTEEQQKLLDAFVATGDAAGAQDFILQALEERYAGTAEAGKKESQLISEAMGEIEESAGKALAALLGGEGENSLSGELFKVSDAIGDLAESKDWKNFGRDLRNTARDLATVAGALKDVYSWGNKVSVSIPGWRTKWTLVTPPIVLIAEALGKAIGALKEYWEWHQKVTGGRVTGDDVPDAPDVSQPLETRASGGPARGLTLVGENGPELARFGSGGYVYNNSQTRDMLSKASAASVNITNVFNGPENLAQARRNDDWAVKYGTRFGAATNAGAM